MSGSVASSSEQSTGAGASDVLQLTLDTCDDRVSQPRYHLFRLAPKLFGDEARLDDNTKIKNGAGHKQNYTQIFFRTCLARKQALDARKQVRK